MDIYSYWSESSIGHYINQNTEFRSQNVYKVSIQLPATNNPQPATSERSGDPAPFAGQPPTKLIQIASISHLCYFACVIEAVSRVANLHTGYRFLAAILYR